MSPPQPTIKDRLKEFPNKLFHTGKGFLEAVLSNVEMTLFIVLGVLIGLASDNAWLGAAIAFGLYTVFYVISQYIGLLNSNFVTLVRLMGEVINERRRSDDSG